MKPWRIKSIFLTVFLLFVAAVLISVVVYPEIFITFQTSFMLWSDYIIEYVLTFVLTNFFYQGGLQLWDYFGQIPMTHTYATFGMFKFQNVVTALLYYILSPFTVHSAALFHHAFAWGNLLSHLILRVVGIFLVLRCLTKNQWIVALGAVLGGVFFSQPAFLWGTFFMSFIPIFMYFVLRFFQTFQWRYLAGAFLFFVVSLGNGIIHTGYMYVGFNSFIVSCVVWSAIFNRQGWVDFWGRVKTFRSPAHLRNIALILLVSVLIVGPYAYIVKFRMHDVAFDVANSRISKMFSPEFYFKKLEISLADPRCFFKDTLSFDWTTNPTVFFGWMVLFLATAGLVLSRKSIKWVFGGAILLLWLLNHPRETVNIGLIGHWINILTNPLKNLARSYFVSSYVTLAYLLIPLACLGIEEILKLWRDEQHARSRWHAVGIIMIILAWTSIPLLPRSCSAYVIVFATIVLLAILALNFRHRRVARTFVVLMGCLLIADIAVIINYSKYHFLYNLDRKPIVLDMAPQLGSVGLDFENPKIFPFRQYQATNFLYSDENSLWIPRGTSSNFRHVTNQGLNFQKLTNHSPRHATFENWRNDPEMLTFVNLNKHTAFMAQEAVRAGDGVLGRICSAGLARDVITVEDPSGKLHLSNRWPADIKPSEEEKVDLKNMTGTFSQNPYYHVQGDMIVFNFRLPADFPKHAATTWFADDQKYLRFLIQRKANEWIEFTHTEGEIIRPYTFDVQNIKEGMMMVAIPKYEYIAQQPFAFFYPSDKNNGVVRLWRSQYDNLGIDFHAEKTGWVVFQYPYDKKWKITVDDKVVEYYRVNKSFIGFPLAQGDHKILIQYWPDTSLRFWLLLSAVLTTLGLPLLIYFGLRWEQENLRSAEQT